ncbi:hypothetical protein [Methylobacterium sp. Leaf113]|uniref:hypothetical protein n=1 Tax=Methylobacterium sp. Leaf113 TaxID=1736259 RepID=UPI001FCD36FB|nr:hypothetical protein [Methylobacterium sp. Leaf113]
MPRQGFHEAPAPEQIGSDCPDHPAQAPRHAIAEKSQSLVHGLATLQHQGQFREKIRNLARIDRERDQPPPPVAGSQGLGLDQDQPARAQIRRQTIGGAKFGFAGGFAPVEGECEIVEARHVGGSLTQGRHTEDFVDGGQALQRLGDTVFDHTGHA